MSDKAYNRKGQTIFEYFILTIIVLSIGLYFTRNRNYVQVQGAATELFNNSVANIVGASSSSVPPIVIPPGSDAQVNIPTSVYLTPRQIRDLGAVGIRIGGRSNYDPADRTIEVTGTLTPAQRAVVERIQGEIRNA